MRFQAPSGIYFHMHPGKLWLLLCAFAAAGCAENPANVAGPVSGFVFDGQAGAIRPMVGIPGAAYLGSAAVVRVDAASVAPDGSAAIATRGGRLILYTGLRGAAPVEAPLEAALGAADHFAWAPDSSAAAIYSSKTGQAQILTGLAGKVAAGAPFDLSAVGGSLAVLAFDGERVVAGIASDTSGGVYLANSQTAPQRIAQAAGPSAIALAGADLYFVDSETQQIWQVKTYARAPAAVPFAKDAGISTPAGLQVSRDGKRLYAADAGQRKLFVYDVASGTAMQALDLAFTPTRLDRFGSDSLFLLNGAGQGPLYVMTDNGQAPAVYFVPAPGVTPRKIRIRPI